LEKVATFISIEESAYERTKDLSFGKDVLGA
jgi:hypothetical protein